MAADSSAAAAMMGRRMAVLVTSNSHQFELSEPSPLAPVAGLRDLSRFAVGLGCLLMAVGTLGALVHGCFLLVFLCFFANLIDSFCSHTDNPDTMARLVNYAFYFLIVL